MKSLQTKKFLWLLPMLLIVLAGCSLASVPVPAGPIQTGPLPGEIASTGLPERLPDATSGAATFAERCTPCHGFEGKGDGELADQLQGQTLPDFSDADFASESSMLSWFTTITNGTIMLGGLMPPWREALSEQERWDVASYLYTLSVPEETFSEGEEIFTESCAACHSAEGEGDEFDDFTVFTNQSRGAILRSFVTNSSDGKHKVADLSESDAQRLAVYVHSLGFDPTVLIVEEEDDQEETAEETDEAEEAEEIADGFGVISGVITNGTSSTPAGGIEVQVRGVTLDEVGLLVEFLSKTAITEADGSYSFAELPFDNEGAAYLIEVFYEGVEFRAGTAIDPTAETDLDIPLTIYDTTTDASSIVIDTMVVLVREGADSLDILQYYNFRSRGDAVFVSDEPVSGGRHAGVSVILPPGAFNVGFQDGQIGGRFIPDGNTNRIFDMDVIQPGMGGHEVLITYSLPLEVANTMSFPLPFDVASVTLLVTEGSRVETDRLNEQGLETIEGDSFQSFTGSTFAMDETLDFSIRQGFALNRETIRQAILIALVMLVAGGIIYLSIQSRMNRERLALVGLNESQITLARNITGLDTDFEAGKVNRFEYEARRATLKAEFAESLGEEEDES